MQDLRVNGSPSLAQPVPLQLTPVQKVIHQTIMGAVQTALVGGFSVIVQGGITSVANQIRSFYGSPPWEFSATNTAAIAVSNLWLSRAVKPLLEKAQVLPKSEITDLVLETLTQIVSVYSSYKGLKYSGFSVHEHELLPLLISVPIANVTRYINKKLQETNEQQKIERPQINLLSKVNPQAT